MPVGVNHFAHDPRVGPENEEKRPEAVGNVNPNPSLIKHARMPDSQLPPL